MSGQRHLGAAQRGDEASRAEDSKSVVTEKVRGCCIGQGRKGGLGGVG